MAVELDADGFDAARRNMVDCQVRPSDVTLVELIDAMSWAPREAFVPKPKRALAYIGENLEIADQRFELDPRTFAKMVDALDPKPFEFALVVGGGLGYAAAVLSRMCEAVVSLESDEAMAAQAGQTLTELRVDNVMVEAGALAEGRAAHAPYDVILVNGGIAAGAKMSALTNQLANGGRMAAVVMDGPIGRCDVWLKSGGAISARRVFDATAPVLPGFEPEEQFVF